MKVIRVNPDDPSESALDTAAEYLNLNRVICYPTETLYGLGANVFSREAYLRILHSKGKKPGEPLIMLILQSWTPDWIEDYESAKPLFDSFWPGGLTVVATPAKRSDMPKWLLSSDNGLAIRSASTRLNERLIEKCGFPIISTSANMVNDRPLRKIDPEDRWLDSSCNIALDAGLIENDIPSTIVDIRAFPEKLPVLRKGVIPIEDIREKFPNTEIEAI